MKTNNKLKETIDDVLTDISDEIICRVDWVDRYSASVLTDQSHDGHHIQIGALMIKATMEDVIRDMLLEIK